MKIDFSSSNELIVYTTKQHLYKLLLEQLEKDFTFSGVHLEIRKNCAPNKLVEMLQSEIKKLILNNFAGYLNLLYRIDVSEKEIKATDGTDVDKLSQQVCFLILKREWQKVWIRSNTVS
ncbi:MAG: hypothetical protein Q8J84_10525 [Flavobacteriaceae bacterium]|nr:hypothetical protein [Flavobacteriaceae bacterium]